MGDDYSTRDADWNQDHIDPDGYRSRQETANFPTGRRDHSRSPPRQPLFDAQRGRDGRHRDHHADVHPMRYERDHDGRHARHARHGHDDSYGRRARDVGDYKDYTAMYDDGYRDEGERDPSPEPEPEPSRLGDARRPSSRSQSPNYRHSRSRSRSPMRDAGRPSDTVILEGLPYVSSNELRESLLTNTAAADFPSIDVRVSAAKGHRRAFVQFEQVDHAVSFMREHYPKLVLDLTHSTDDVPEGKLDTYIHYARSRESRDDMDTRIGGEDWACPMCDFSNYSTRSKCKICGATQPAPNWQQNLTGLTDAANVPSQILVVYPLPAFVTEDMLASDMKRLELEKPDTTRDNANGPKLKSTAPTGNTAGLGARPGSLHRVFIVRDSVTDESFKYGFAEFWTLEDAAAAVTKFQKSRVFTVSACPATVSTIHMGVFVPEEREVTPPIERMSFHPLFNPTIRVRYRDLHVYPRQHLVTSSPPFPDHGKQQATEAGGDWKKSKKRKAESGAPGSVVKKQVPMAGQLAVWQRKSSELREPGGPSEGGVASAANSTPIRISLSGSSSSAASSKPQAIKIAISATTTLGAPQDAKADESTAAQPAATDDKAQETVSYCDRDRLMCLICMRKYKSVEEVDIHEKSRNHKKAMENEEQVKAALPRLAARDKRLQKHSQDQAGAGSQYRDRAKERRNAHRQPTKPASSGQQGKKPPAKQDEAAEKTAKPAAQQQSKGAGMLAKMGWSAGTGLGANSDGRTEVIATKAYQEGVGLGAEGGELGDAATVAERKTKNNYADYLNTVQDKARERYNKMS